MNYLNLIEIDDFGVGGFQISQERKPRKHKGNLCSIFGNISNIEMKIIYRKSDSSYLDSRQCVVKRHNVSDNLN